MAISTPHLIECLLVLAGSVVFQVQRPRHGYRHWFRAWAWRRRVDRSLRGVR